MIKITLELNDLTFNIIFFIFIKRIIFLLF